MLSAGAALASGVIPRRVLAWEVWSGLLLAAAFAGLCYLLQMGHGGNAGKVARLRHLNCFLDQLALLLGGHFADIGRSSDPGSGFGGCLDHGDASL